MNYFELHLGDYDSATAHLSLIEDGVYSRLLRTYYRTEAPLVADMDRLCRLIRVTDKRERASVETILEEFFERHDDGWHNPRADAEIARYNSKRAKAKASIEKRWERVRDGFEGNKDVSGTNVPNGYEGNTPRARLHTPVTRHQAEEQRQVSFADSSPAAEKPPPDDPPPASDPHSLTLDAGMPPCPHAAIIALYHEILPTLRRVRDWTPARQKLLRQRWREKVERQSLDWWDDFFRYVASCDWLMGRIPGRGGKPFDCDLEWLIRPTNFVKVLEGRYQNSGAA